MLSTTTRRRVLLALPMALLLHGCQTTGGFISAASFSGLDSRPDAICESQDPAVYAGCTAERRQSLAFAPLGNDVTDLVFLDIRGSGRCGQLQVDFGDGPPIETYLDKQIHRSLQLTHHYTGWPGRKIARVIAGQNCTGSRTAEVTVGFEPDGQVVMLPAMLSCWRYAVPLHLGICGLLLLYLPILSRLQFYLGYPLRAFTAHASTVLLALVGIDASATGAAILHQGTTVLVHAPCAGIGMLWIGSYTAALLSYLNRANAAQTALNAGTAALLVLAANVARNTALFFPEARLVHWPAWSHEAIGLGALALAIVPIVLISTRHSR